LKSKVSIIIRTKNEEAWIYHCLNAINKQDYPNYEIIIVDNQSTDNTIPIIKTFDDINIVNIKNYLPGLALNEGIKNSTGEYIAIISAHCIPAAESWLTKLINNFSDENVAGVYGKQLPVAYSDPRDVRDMYISFGDEKRIQTKDSFFHNANSAIRKSEWDENPFKDEVTNIEDRIWAKEILLQGKNIIYDPEASVFHYHGIHQSDNINRVKSTVNIIKSIDKDNNLNKIPFSMKPEQSNIIAIVPLKTPPPRINDFDPLASLVDTIEKSKYIKKSYFITNLNEISGGSGPKKHPIINRPIEEDMSLGGILNWSLNKINEKKCFPDYIVYLNPEYVFRPPNFLDKIIKQIIFKGLDSVFMGYQDYSNYWSFEHENNKYIPINTELTSRNNKFPLFKSLFGLGCIVRPKLIFNETLVSDEKVEIISTSNFKYTLRTNDSHMKKMIEAML